MRLFALLTLLALLPLGSAFVSLPLGLALLAAVSVTAALGAAAAVLSLLKESDERLAGRIVEERARAAAEKNELFMTVAHDMRGSLAVIEGGSDIIARLPGMPEKAMKYARAMRFAGRTLNGMVKDILNLNKMQAGVMELSPAPFSVNRLLAAMPEVHEVPCGMRGVTMAAQPLAEDLSLAADQGLIERIFTNLAAHALKFTPPGGRIEFSCRHVDAERVCFCISDTGDAVPVEKRGLSIEKNGATEKEEPRTFDLGLEMCRRAVELHGGRIWVQSEAGKGACYFFTVSRRLAPTA